MDNEKRVDTKARKVGRAGRLKKQPTRNGRIKRKGIKLKIFSKMQLKKEVNKAVRESKFNAYESKIRIGIKRGICIYIS